MNLINLFYSFMNGIGPMVVFWMAYEYAMLKLKVNVLNQLVLKAISSTIGYLCTSIIYIIIFNNAYAFIYFIGFPVIMMLPEIYYRAKGIKRSPQAESPLEGFKYIKNNEQKTVPPWIAVCIVLVIAYLLNFILWSLDKAVS